MEKYYDSQGSQSLWFFRFIFLGTVAVVFALALTV